MVAIETTEFCKPIQNYNTVLVQLVHNLCSFQIPPNDFIQLCHWNTGSLWITVNKLSELFDMHLLQGQSFHENWAGQINNKNNYDKFTYLNGSGLENPISDLSIARYSLQVNYRLVFWWTPILPMKFVAKWTTYEQYSLKVSSFG